MSTLALHPPASVSTRYPLAEAIKYLGIKTCDTARVKTYLARFVREYRWSKKKLTEEAYTTLLIGSLIFHAGIVSTIGYLWKGHPILFVIGFASAWWGCVGLDPRLSRMINIRHGDSSWKWPQALRFVCLACRRAMGEWFPYLMDRFCRPETRYVQDISIRANDCDKEPLRYFGRRIKMECPSAQVELRHLYDDCVLVDRFLWVTLGHEEYYVSQKDKFD